MGVMLSLSQNLQVGYWSSNFGLGDNSHDFPNTDIGVHGRMDGRAEKGGML
jgi:hypothetical protein